MSNQQPPFLKINLSPIQRFQKYQMNSKYKIMKYQGFNPFRSNQSRGLNQFMSKDRAEMQKTKSRNKLNMKEIALILQNNQQGFEQNEQNANRESKSVVRQNYELHKYCQSQGENTRKSIVMFNEREYCQKTFDEVYTQKDLKSKQHEFHEKIFNLQQKKQSKQNSRLIIYLANSRQASQKVILGHNQTLSNSQEPQNSTSLLNAVYQKMLEEKTIQNQQKPSNIYFSAIGIQKENNLYDLLNEQHINNDGQLSLGQVLNVRVRKILKDHDSIIAENLKKQILKDHNHLNELIEKSKQIRNFIEFYDNFNETFFLGQLYHFYEANSDYDLFNECVVLKINQHFPKISASTYVDGFYQRRIMESNSSRISTLIMRIGLNIKACRKNKMLRQASHIVPKKMSQVEMHQSKILLFLGPFFMNLNTHYVLINEVGTGATISDEIKNFELNRGFMPDKHSGNIKLASFYHTKHYLDLPQVQEIIKKLAVKFAMQDKPQSSLKLNKPKSVLSQNSSRARDHHQILVQQQEQANEQYKFLQSMKHNKFSHTQTYRTFETETRGHKSMLREGQRVKSKSFFCHTISSSQRNYWKSKDRDSKKHQKLIDIGKLLYNQQDTISGINEKTINSKTQDMKFIDQKKLMKKSLQGVRVTYKRKLVVRTFSKADASFIMGRKE